MVAESSYVKDKTNFLLYILSHILWIAISFLLAVDPAQESSVIGKTKKSILKGHESSRSHHPQVRLWHDYSWFNELEMQTRFDSNPNSPIQRKHYDCEHLSEGSQSGKSCMLKLSTLSHLWEEKSSVLITISSVTRLWNP